MMVLSRVFALLIVGVICASAGPPFDRYGDMTPSEKSRMRTRRMFLGKLNKKVQKALLCQRCDGKGRIIVQVRIPLPGNTSVLEDRLKKCPICFGSKIHPWADFNHKLSKYYNAKRKFERDYPFKSPVKTGLEANIFRRVRTAKEQGMVNLYARQMLRKGTGGQAFLVVVRIESWARAKDGKGVIMDALVLDPRKPTQGIPITLELPKAKVGLAERTKFLVLAWDQDAEKGVTGMGDKNLTPTDLRALRKRKKEARKNPKPLTILYFKHLKG